MNWWNVVGKGYTWLVGSIVTAVGALAAAFGGDVAAWAGVVLAVGAVATARVKDLSGALLGTAAVGFVLGGIAQAGESSLEVSAGVLVGSLFLGGVSSEMFLGHWFLIDPKLPRWSLFTLAAIGGAGLLGEVVYTAIGGGFAADDGLLVATYAALAILSGLLVAGVWFSLREPRYSGVMAATGLSYLAMLTAFGVVVVGRALVVNG